MMGFSAMTLRIVGEAETDRHAGGMTQRAQQETVAATRESFTGQYLKPLLERASVKPTVVETKPKRPARSRRVVVDEDEPDLIAAK